MNRRSKKKRSGQTALIVLLIMVVILTIGLSLVSRSITDIKISQNEKEATRAFSAAEAGIEQALSDITPFLGNPNPSSVSVGNLTAHVSVQESGEQTTQTLENGETMNVLLDGTTANNLFVNWIDENKAEETGNKASLEITVYKDDYTFQRGAYNGESRSNGFTDIGYNPSGDFNRRVSVSIDSNDKLVRIKVLYNKTTIMVATNDSSLPVQLYKITSSATEGEKTGKIIVSRTVPVLAPIFDYALFSGGNLSN